MAQAQVAREAFAVASVLQKSRLLGRLTSLRATLNGLVKVGSTMTHGLTDDLLVPFENDKYLNRALDLAETNLESIHAHHGEYLSRSEEDCIGVLQEDYENFYEPHFKNPYIPMGSNGPWIVTTHGNVIHDNGGYGMLGLGHTPSEITPALHGHDCQANIMTASFEAKEFADLLRQELGHRNMTENPFPKFMCLNSGSEGVELALRVSDAYSKQVAPDWGWRQSQADNCNGGLFSWAYHESRKLITELLAEIPEEPGELGAAATCNTRSSERFRRPPREIPGAAGAGCARGSGCYGAHTGRRRSRF